LAAVTPVSFSRTASLHLADSVPTNATHPGPCNFSPLLGRYVQEQRLIPLEEAAAGRAAGGSLGLARGPARARYFADVIVFDPTVPAGPPTSTHQYVASATWW
jgi:N-acyl-D-aspartate/D-glutamate deacylase